MSPALLAELSAKYEREVPVIRGFGSFAAFSDTYVAATDVLRERDDWERLADQSVRQHVAAGCGLPRAHLLGRELPPPLRLRPGVLGAWCGRSSTPPPPATASPCAGWSPVDRVRDTPDEALAWPSSRWPTPTTS